MKELPKSPDPVGSTVHIGIAVVLVDSQVLVGIRADDADLAGHHEFPGGKCFPEESAAECAIRECLEETGLRVNTRELLLRTKHHYPHASVDLSFFLCEPAESPAPITRPFKWISLHQLASCNFPEGNAGVIERLLDRLQTGTL